jgi:V/A-type H+/Na+-transporting ATPase subunit I
MAIAEVQKILIISHQSQSQALLSAIQKAGIVHMLDDESSAVLKAYEELKTKASRDRESEDTSQKLEKAIAFLKEHRKGEQLASLLAPRVVVDDYKFNETVGSDQPQTLLKKVVELSNEIGKLAGERDNLNLRLESLRPWTPLKDDLANFAQLDSVDVFAGAVPVTNWQQLNDEFEQGDAGANVHTVSSNKTTVYAVILALKEQSSQIHKLLRASEFESVHFEGMKGTVSENIERLEDDLRSVKERSGELTAQATELADSLLDLEILYDHFGNKRIAGEVFNKSGATERTRIFEGWVRKTDIARLKKLINDYDASSMCLMEPEADEEIPVGIVNKSFAEPFEVITRFYGMPRYFEVDPTVILAPFFAIFFALCLSDAGYGLVMIGVSVYMLKRMQFGKGFMRLLLICSILTIFTGAMTGGWFGNTILEAARKFDIGWLESFIAKTTWFNPLEDPMTFLALSIVMGYLQIMTGLIVGYFKVLRNSGFFAAACDKLSWLVMLNSIVVMAVAKSGYLPLPAAKFAIILIIVSAATILLLSHREGTVGARLGMGSYNLFSAIFYLGDLLSYLRLMALGMATGGVAMAVNIIAGLVGDTPYVGWLLALIFLIIGHSFNILQSLLGAFVHSLRLQFVEFFPKFLEGGGKDFKPFAEDYKYIYLRDNQNFK